MENTVGEPGTLLERALNLARVRPISEVRPLFRAAEAQATIARDPAALARVLIEEARVLAEAFDARLLPEAHAFLDRSRDLLDERPDKCLGARLDHVRGYAHLRGGNPGRALTALLDAERAFVELADSSGEARVLDTLGVLWDRRGDYERALLLVARSLAIKQQGGDKSGAAMSLGNMGRVALHAGRFDDAERFFRLDLALARELGDVRGEAQVRTNLSECALAQDRPAEARSEALTALAASLGADDDARCAFALIAIANAELALGEPKRALERIAEARGRFEERGLGAGIAHARVAECRVRLTLDEPRAAALVALRAARSARAACVFDVEIEALLEANRALSAGGDRPRARRVLNRAHDRARRGGFDARLRQILARERATTVEMVARADEVIIYLEEATGRLAALVGRPIPFRLERFIGRGAFATVVKARELRTGDVFALKQLKFDDERPRDVVARLRREFTAVSRVDHPRVARPHGFGTESGRPCLLMDFIDSGGRHHSLQDLLEDSGVLPIADTIRIARDIAEGVAALHAAGVAHRDLKPANVLFDGDGRAVLTDFNLSRDLHEGSYVPEGAFKGTLPYVAPENCVLEGEGPRDAPLMAVDWYALGVILFQALTGRWPIPLEEAKGDVVKLFRMKASTVPPDVRTLRPEVPRRLAQLVAALLVAQPRDRTTDAAQIARILDDVFGELS